MRIAGLSDESGKSATASLRDFAAEFLLFGVKELRACLFTGIFFSILILSSNISLLGIARYDLIFILTVSAQVLLLAFGVETKDEAMTLCLFHIIGLGLELFKTHPAIASWSYPEAGFLKIGTVPLYSGFMYAAVASYLCQAWRIFHLELYRYPSYWLSVPLSAAIYLNFFTHHLSFVPDFRWLLMLCVLAVFRRTTVRFTVLKEPREMPVVVSFLLIGFFIWVAENIATYLGAWRYPDQHEAWRIVSLSKISSWFLLVIISFVIVADLKYVRGKKRDVVVRDSE